MNVDVDHALGGAVVLVDELAQRHDSRVVDEHVERAEALFDLVEEALEGVAKGDIELERERVAAELGRRLLGQLAVEVADRDLGALAHQRLSGGLADPPCAAGDRHYLAVQRTRLPCHRFEFLLLVVRPAAHGRDIGEPTDAGRTKIQAASSAHAEPPGWAISLSWWRARSRPNPRRLNRRCTACPRPIRARRRFRSTRFGGSGRTSPASARRACPTRPGRANFDLARTRRMAFDPLPILLSAYEEFGPIFSLRLMHSPVVFMLGPAANHYVTVSHPHNFHWREGSFGDLIPLLGDGLLTIDAGYHDRARRIMLPAFHHEQIEASVEAMVVEAEAAIAHLAP